MTGTTHADPTAVDTERRCCKPWIDEPPSRRRVWAWQAVHQYAHSRVPFSVERFGTVADVDAVQASKIIAAAVNRDWITPVNADGLYVGRLKARR
jgi:hypothetical protein